MTIIVLYIITEVQLLLKTTFKYKMYLKNLTIVKKYLFLCKFKEPS